MRKSKKGQQNNAKKSKKGGSIEDQKVDTVGDESFEIHEIIPNSLSSYDVEDEIVD